MIFIAMIVERHIISAELKSLFEDIDPAGAVQIVIFEKIDDGVVGKIELHYMVEHHQKGLRFCPRFHFQNAIALLIFQKVVAARPLSDIEKKCDVCAIGVDRF